MSQPSVPIEVLLAEPQPIYRQGLIQGLHTTTEIEIVEAVDCGEKAIDAIKRLAPDVAVLAIHFTDVSGLDVLQKCFGARTRFIILTADPNPMVVYRAVRRGADGFLLKNDDVDLITAIRRVHGGEVVIAPQALRKLIDLTRSLPARLDTEVQLLSAREHEVLSLMRDGHSMREIATRLSISMSTVKAHSRTAYQKLSVHDRLAAVAEANRRGLL